MIYSQYSCQLMSTSQTLELKALTPAHHILVKVTELILYQSMSEIEDAGIKQKQTRQQLQQMLQREDINVFLDVANMVISFILIYAYIHSTYDPRPFQNTQWAVFNTLFHLLLFIEWAFKIYAAKSLYSFLISQESIVQLFSLVPYFFIKIPLLKLFQEDDDRINQVANLMVLLRGLEFDRLRKYMDSEVNKQLTSILVSITTLIIAAAGALHYNSLFIADDSPEDKFQYHYFIYFVMTTISTMGYENKFSTAASRVLIIILVIFALTFVPMQSSELIRHLSSKSYYARLTYKASDSVPHIVILGSISNNSAENFFKELFHPDHGLAQKHAIILSPHRPDPALETMIRSPEYSNVIYVQGDPHLDKDLKRCSLEKAKAIILICNKQSADASAEDSKTILLAIIIKSYLKQHLPAGQKIRFCMQVLRHEGKTHYFLSLNKQAKLDQVICIEELKMSLLAKACLCPGLIAFFSNLIASSGSPPESLSIKWLSEYWNGQGFEIYKTQLPSYFRGKTFSQTVLILYKRFQVILFGLELVCQDFEKILLNPGEMQIPSQSTYKIMGYIISQDKETADLIANYKSTERANSRVIEVDHRRSKRQTILQTVQTFLGFKKEESPKRKPKRLNRDHTFVMPSRPIGGWIKMKSFNPSVDTLVPTKEQDEAFIDEEDENEVQEMENNVQFKTKLKSENLRNFLQVDFNKIYQTCHLTNEKVNLKDITCKTLQDSILAQNHVILCGLVTNLIHFVVPLRQKYLTNYPPIVILNEVEPSEKQWNQICLFPEIYFVKGSAMKKEDLIKANLMKAMKVVILSPKVEDIQSAKAEEDAADDGMGNQGENIQQLSKEQEDLLDARTIFKYRNIIQHKPHIQIVTEFVNPSNIQFLLYDKDYALMKEFGYNQTPLFASGQIYFASVMDSLLCQSYYNPALVTVLYNLLVSSGSTIQTGSKDTKSSVGNTMNGTTHQKDQYSDIQPSNLFQMQIPTAFLGKKFDALFYFLVKMKSIVPLALYRLSGATDNKTPYICTNPNPSTEVGRKDLLLVLAQEMPPSDSINWGGPLEVKPQQAGNSFNVFQKQTTISSMENEIIFINDDNDKEVQKAKQFNSETDVVLKKIQACIEEVQKLQSEATDISEQMNGRQERIIRRMKDVFAEELNNVMTKKNEVSQNLTYKSSED